MKPIVVSACLAGEFCRYDGGATPCPEVLKLVKAGLALPLCPEMLGGLEAPRSPCERRGDRVLGKDGQDYTAAFQRGVEQALRLAQEAGCTVGILKERSPSCGVHKVYDGSFTRSIVSGRGLWAEKLLQSGFRLYSEQALESDTVGVPHLPIITERLILRQWLPEDRIPFAALNADVEVMRYCPEPLTLEASNALQDRLTALIAEQGWGFWAVERQSDGTFLGFVGLHRPDQLPCSPCMEIGWRLAREYWGQGYATEAARACMRFAFEVLGEPSVVAFTAEMNQRSQAVMRRLEMVQETGFEHPSLRVGHPLRPHVLFRAVAPETTVHCDNKDAPYPIALPFALPSTPPSEICVRGVWTWSEHPLCDEHFVGAPRVPGTLILAMFEERIREHFPHVRVMGIRRFRFVHFVEPATYTYELTVEHGADQVHCTLWSGERCMAEGSILIACSVDVR